MNLYVYVYAYVFMYVSIRPLARFGMSPPKVLAFRIPEAQVLQDSFSEADRQLRSLEARPVRGLWVGAGHWFRQGVAEILVGGCGFLAGLALPPARARLRGARSSWRVTSGRRSASSS